MESELGTRVKRAVATETDCPRNLVGLDELRRRLAREDIVLLDALPTEVYRRAHIPGALSLPAGLAPQLAPVYVPDRAAEVVVYGSNAGSEAARRLAARLCVLGYTNVRLFVGGTDEWMRCLLPLVKADGV